MLLDRQQIPVMWWDFRNAYPVKWTGPKLDASNGTNVAVEQVELAHQGLSKLVASQLLGGVRAGLQMGNVL
jgi:phage tail-like protein